MDEIPDTPTDDPMEAYNRFLAHVKQSSIHCAKRFCDLHPHGWWNDNMDVYVSCGTCGIGDACANLSDYGYRTPDEQIKG